MITIFNDNNNVSKLEKPVKNPGKFNLVGHSLWFSTLVVVIAILVKLVR